MTDRNKTDTEIVTSRHELEAEGFPIIAALPDALRLPTEGQAVFESLIGAQILQIGTTTPGIFEGGGLIIDYQHSDRAAARLCAGFFGIGDVG